MYHLYEKYESMQVQLNGLKSGVERFKPFKIESQKVETHKS